MSIDEIKKLDIKERIILMNEIWETLDCEQDSIETPLWHKEVLDERVNKINNKEARYISLEELKYK
jgi:putative addiction module component (TIGR02574 family)